jgi:hypothetical protein
MDENDLNLRGWKGHGDYESGWGGAKSGARTGGKPQVFSGRRDEVGCVRRDGNGVMMSVEGVGPWDVSGLQKKLGSVMIERSWCASRDWNWTAGAKVWVVRGVRVDERVRFGESELRRNEDAGVHGRFLVVVTL